MCIRDSLHPARERFRYGCAALADGVPVERDVLGEDAELGAAPGLGVDLRRAQDRLGRDAGVIEAAPTGFVTLDDGGFAAQLGGADRRHIAAGATADND